MKEIIKFTFLFVALATSWISAHGQAPEVGTYGNEWIEGKYGQPWLKIEIPEKGIYKITLPSTFQNKSNKLHLYRRGIEVALISSSNTEIEFFGVPNDGASDALLYRPYTGTRANPYFSWFSDIGYYFLTVSESGPSTKLAAHQSSKPLSGSALTYHWQRDVSVYTQEDTYTGSRNSMLHGGNYPSYLKEGKGRSSQMTYDCNCSLIPGYKSTFDFPFQLDRPYLNNTVGGEIEVLLNGRSVTANNISAHLGISSSQNNPVGTNV
jgi:hypothetical protein